MIAWFISVAVVFGACAAMLGGLAVYVYWAARGWPTPGLGARIDRMLDWAEERGKAAREREEARARCFLCSGDGRVRKRMEDLSDLELRRYGYHPPYIDCPRCGGTGRAVS